MSKQEIKVLEQVPGGVMVASDHSALEEGGVAFDPASQYLDLSKEEKRRTTSLLMAIQAYEKLIIKDAEYLREVYAQQRGQSDGPKIMPATIDAMLDAAWKFDLFISGKLEDGAAEPEKQAVNILEESEAPND